jgi:hypothetical protein
VIGRGRFPIYAGLVKWWLLLLAACVTSSAPVRPAAKAQLYVDGSALDEGDGSAEHPFKKLVVREQTVTRVASGLYAFDGELPPGAELQGEGEVVLHAEGEAPAVVTLHGGRLEHVSLQGGQWGAVCDGEVELSDVKLSGQRAGGIHVLGGTLKLSGAVDGTLPDTLGVRVEPKAHLVVHGARFTGSLKRAIDAEEATVEIDGLKSDGPAQALHALKGTTSVRNASASHGPGPAFNVAAGRLELRLVEVIGHEYGVLVSDGAELVIDGLRSERAQIAAVSLVLSKATVRNLKAVSPGSHGAVEALESTSEVHGVEQTGGTDLSVWVRHGTMTATDVTVTGLTGIPADAVHVRDAKATLARVRATNIEGSGVGVTAVGDAEVSDVQCTRCGHGVLVVERRSHARAKHLRSDAAPVVAALDDASVELEDLKAPGDGPLVWAECEGGTHVTVHGSTERVSGGCVEVK